MQVGYLNYVQLQPTSACLDAKSGRHFVQLNRGAAMRIALSMSVGYAYGTCEGALLVLVCNGVGSVNGYITILIASLVAVANFTMRFEDSFGRYGFTVASNLMMGTYLVAATDPGQTEYDFFDRRSILENVIAWAFLFFGFIVPVLAASFIVPTIPVGGGRLARAPTSACDAKALCRETLERSAELFAHISNILRPTEPAAATSGVGAGEYFIDERFWNMQAIRDTEARSMDALTRAAYELSRVSVPTRRRLAEGLIKGSFAVTRKAKTVLDALHCPSRRPPIASIVKLYGHEGIRLRAKLYADFHTCLAACIDVLFTSGTSMSTEAVEQSAIALNATWAALASHIEKAFRKNSILADPRREETGSYQPLSVAEMRKVTYMTVFTASIRVSCLELVDTTLDIVSDRRSGGLTLAAEIGQTAVGAASMVFLPLVWLVRPLIGPCTRVGGQRDIATDQFVTYVGGGGVKDRMGTLSSSMKKYFLEWSPPMSAPQMSAHHDDGRLPTGMRSILAFWKTQWSLHRIQLALQFACVVYVSLLPCVVPVMRSWLQNDGSLGFWIYITGAPREQEFAPIG